MGQILSIPYAKFRTVSISRTLTRFDIVHRSNRFGTVKGKVFRRWLPHPTLEGGSGKITALALLTAQPLLKVCDLTDVLLVLPRQQDMDADRVYGRFGESLCYVILENSLNLPRYVRYGLCVASGHKLSPTLHVHRQFSPPFKLFPNNNIKMIHYYHQSCIMGSKANTS